MLFNDEVTITSTNTTIIAENTAIISSTIESGDVLINAGNAITLLNSSITSTQAGEIVIGSTDTPPNKILIDRDTIISSNAPTITSNAGTIIIYAIETIFRGTLSATAQGGNGGFIELSARRSLKHYSTNIFTNSHSGDSGTIFIDPTVLAIVDLDPTTLPDGDLFQLALRDLGNQISSGSFGSTVATTDTHILIGGTLPGTTPPSPGGNGNAYLYNIVSETWTDLSTTPGNPIMGIASTNLFARGVVGLALNATYALIGASGVAGTVPTDIRSCVSLPP